MQWMNRPLGTRRGNAHPVIIRSAELPVVRLAKDCLGLLSRLAQNVQRVALLLSQP
jgi:hypothetical protein